MKTYLLLASLCAGLFAAEKSEILDSGAHQIGPGITLQSVGSGIAAANDPRVELLTNELGLQFIGGALDGTKFTIGSTTSFLSTNVVYGHNGQGCGDCRGIWMHNWALHHDTTHPGHDGRPWKDATAQWWITNVVQVQTLVFAWLGKERNVTDEFLISSVTNYQVLQHQWVTTNAPPPPDLPRQTRIPFSTNFSTNFSLLYIGTP